MSLQLSRFHVQFCFCHCKLSVPEGPLDLTNTGIMHRMFGFVSPDCVTRLATPDHAFGPPRSRPTFYVTLGASLFEPYSPYRWYLLPIGVQWSSLRVVPSRLPVPPKQYFEITLWNIETHNIIQLTTPSCVGPCTEVSIAHRRWQACQVFRSACIPYENTCQIHTSVLEAPT